MIRAITLAGLFLAAPTAFAQQAATTEQFSGSVVGGGSKTMGALLSEGYEIKASVPNGTKFIVFMQKEKSAYACDFVSITRTRCGSIN